MTAGMPRLLARYHQLLQVLVLVVFCLITILSCCYYLLNPAVKPCAAAKPLMCSSDIVHTPLNAFVFSCAAKCDTTLLCLAVISLRAFGGWAGPIYIVSDFDACSQISCILQMKCRCLRIPPVRSSMDIKSPKRKILYLLPEYIKGAIYMDVDIFTFGCVRDFIDILNIHKSAPIGMFHDDDCPHCNIFGGGFIYIQRKAEAKNCMKAWENQTLLNTRSLKDQDSLDEALQKGECQNIREIPANQLASLPSLWDIFHNRLKLNPPVFLHFNHNMRNGRLWNIVKHRVYRKIFSAWEDAKLSAGAATSYCKRN